MPYTHWLKKISKKNGNSYETGAYCPIEFRSPSRVVGVEIQNKPAGKALIVGEYWDDPTFDCPDQVSFSVYSQDRIDKENGFQRSPELDSEEMEDENCQSQSFVHQFKAMQKKVHDLAMKNGFWDAHNDDMLFDGEHGKFAPRNSIGEKLALVHSEISEALEAAREDYRGVLDVRGFKKVDKNGKFMSFNSVEEELADAIIRIMDMAEAYGLNIASAILEKHAYNESRPHKHGKNF